jgi:hypothetical protein
MYKMSLDRKFINLKVISKLEKGQKLNCKNDLFTIENPGGLFYYTSFLRWIRDDSRKSTFNSLSELIKECLHDIEKETFGCDNTKKLIVELILSLNGIKNLISTYELDITFQASMELLIDSINIVKLKYEEENEKVSIKNNNCSVVQAINIKNPDSIYKANSTQTKDKNNNVKNGANTSKKN